MTGLFCTESSIWAQPSPIPTLVGGFGMAGFLLAFGVFCFSLSLIWISLYLWYSGFIHFTAHSPPFAADSDSRIAAKKAEIAEHQRELSKMILENKKEAKTKKFEQGKGRTVCPFSFSTSVCLPGSSAIGLADALCFSSNDPTVVGGGYLYWGSPSDL